MFLKSYYCLFLFLTLYYRPPNGPFALPRYEGKLMRGPTPFPLRDAAAHNQLVDMLNASVASLTSHVDQFLLYSHDVEVHGHLLLSRDAEHELLQRYALFRFKREQMLAALALPSYRNAYYFGTAMHADVRAIAKLLMLAADELGTQLFCDDGELDDDDRLMRERNDHEAHMFSLVAFAALGVLVYCVQKSPLVRKQVRRHVTKKKD